MATELLSYIGLGLLGGLILNVMPCVLPVLTMKVFHLLEHGQGGARVRRLHGVAYAGGVLLTFLVLALAVVALRASGERIGWGMQFQHPPFIAGIVALIFTFGLNALGVFEWSVSMSGRPGHHGYGGSFANGIFAAVMSTPCSAPFLGSAAAFALAAETSWWQTVTLFACIGVGLASPFLAVSFVPAIARMLPRPGPWMETFKHLMGFALLGAAVWLFSVLQAQVSRASSAAFLLFLLVLAMALWATHRFGGVIHGTGRRIGVRAVSAAVVLVAGSQLIHFQPVEHAGVRTIGDANGPVVADGKIVWAPFSVQQVAAARAGKRPVFMDFTADWCVNCKTNERVFIETGAVRESLQKGHILPMKADMTNENEEIQSWLDKLGRSGIPAYVIYLPDGTTDLLPEVITTAMVVERLEAASKRFPPQVAVNRP